MARDYDVEERAPVDWASRLTAPVAGAQIFGGPGTTMINNAAGARDAQGLKFGLYEDPGNTMFAGPDGRIYTLITEDIKTSVPGAGDYGDNAAFKQALMGAMQPLSSFGNLQGVNTAGAIGAVPMEFVDKAIVQYGMGHTDPNPTAQKYGLGAVGGIIGAGLLANAGIIPGGPGYDGTGLSSLIDAGGGAGDLTGGADVGGAGGGGSSQPSLPFGNTSVGDYLSATSGEPFQMPTGAGAATTPSFLSGSNGVADYLSAFSSPGAASAAGTALSRIMDGTATSADYLSTLGTVGQAGLGAYAGLQQADATNALGDRILNMGAPSLARYEASFAPGFDLWSQPAYKGALDASTDSIMRSLSASTGSNPWGNPGAMSAGQEKLMGSLGLPALQNYRETNRAAGFGNVPQYAQISQNAIGQQGGAWEAAGAGLQSLLQPKKNYTLNLGDLLA